MCRIKNLAILLGLCMAITACGSSEQQKSKVMLYQGDKNKKEEEHYKTTKVKKGTYEEKISATASLVYQNDKAVMIKDSNAYLDKILVKNGQKVVKGQKLATYHVKISDTKLKKKKLETEQARSEYDVNLKSKRNEVLQQERTIKTLTDATEKKLAVLQLNKLKSEYKDLQKQGKSIQKKEKDFRKKLQAEMQKRQRLAKQLDKLIANQIKKSGSTTSTYKLTPEEQLVSNDFAKNKGKLPWPVTEGFISEKFGVFNHSIHKLVEVASRGIGITTSKNAEVRSVFQGVVSVAMYMNDIDSYVVIIRHGSYFTVYINLQEVKVNQGDVVKTKQVIGKVAHDEEKGSVLNFEVFKDTEKLNPELWLAK